jgi:hypothetical protein
MKYVLRFFQYTAAVLGIFTLLYAAILLAVSFLTWTSPLTVLGALSWFVVRGAILVAGMLAAIFILAQVGAELT